MLVSVFIWEYLKFIERSWRLLVLVNILILGYTLVRHILDYEYLLHDLSQLSEDTIKGSVHAD